MNEDKFAQKFKIKSIRLNNWNYSSAGIYFITICTHNHNHHFGKILDGKMVLSTAGEIAQTELFKTIKIRKNISIKHWVIMPNHIHILVNIRDQPVETPSWASLHESQKITIIIPSHKNHPDFFRKLTIKSKQEVPKLINHFKSAVKKECNRQKLFFSWQSRYHDHIIRSQEEYLKINNYIISNPTNWQKDKYFNNKK